MTMYADPIIDHDQNINCIHWYVNIDGTQVSGSIKSDGLHIVEAIQAHEQVQQHASQDVVYTVHCINYGETMWEEYIIRAILKKM